MEQLATRVSTAIPVTIPAPSFSSASTGGIAAFERAMNEAFVEIVKLQGRATKAPGLSARELILYQVRTSHFALQVELTSKLGEGVSATLRRLQQLHQG